jgi:hypothetical protein
MLTLSPRPSDKHNTFFLTGQQGGGDKESPAGHNTMQELISSRNWFHDIIFHGYVLVHGINLQLWDEIIIF